MKHQKPPPSVDVTVIEKRVEAEITKPVHPPQTLLNEAHKPKESIVKTWKLATVAHSKDPNESATIAAPKSLGAMS